MPTYISPDGNPEMWDQKPNGYFTPEEWEADHPAPPPTEEDLYNEERAAVEFKYSSPWNGETGGILSMLQMTFIAALARGEDITEISSQYQTELSAMNAEFSAIDEKYGVA